MPFPHVLYGKFAIKSTANKPVKWRVLLPGRALVAGLASVVASWCLLPSLAAAAPARALQVTDDRGAVVRFVQSPLRIVSLLPALTESICALDQCHRLVGVDRYSNYPASVQHLPQVGGGMDPNIEAIAALRPDVVLLAMSSRVSERLESLGIKVVALEPKRHADVRRVLSVLGTLLQIPEAEGADHIWRTLNAGISAAARSIPANAKGWQVYFEVSPGPYAASEASFIGETLTRLGMKNTVPAALGPFPLINPEFVVRANPDIIMAGNRSMQAMGAYPGWSGIRAVQAGRLCAFTSLQADVLVRPGPRMAEAARTMAQCIAEQASKPVPPASTGVARPPVKAGKI